MAGTVAIPSDKLAEVKETILKWDHKSHCTKRELQSVLGTLLYVHKCVRPARTFLNRMLDLLRHAPDPSRIALTEDFSRDLRWFKKFLPNYNGISLYTHKKYDHVIELNSCLTGLGVVVVTWFITLQYPKVLEILISFT